MVCSSETTCCGKVASFFISRLFAEEAAVLLYGPDLPNELRHPSRGAHVGAEHLAVYAAFVYRVVRIGCALSRAYMESSPHLGVLGLDVELKGHLIFDLMGDLGRKQPALSVVQ